MATVSSSTGYSVSSSVSSKGLSGMVSGLDTEEMVEKLLSGTQSKIDTQKAKRQQLVWKQQSYRDVVTSLRNFQTSYFSFSNPTTNLLSSTFFNTMSAVSSSTAVKVGATQDAAAGTVTINKVTQLATTRKEKSAQKVTGDLKATIDGAALKAAADEGKMTLELTLDGVKKTFTLNIKTIGEGQYSLDIDQLKKDVEKAFGSGIEIDINGDGFTIEAKDNRQVTVSGDSAVLSALGLKSGQSNKLNLSMELGRINFATPLQGSEFEFTINGTKITASANDTLRSLISKINSSDAGVTVSYSAVDDTFSVESKTAGANIEINMSQDKGNLLTALFGVAGSGAVTSKGLTTTVTEGEKTTTVTATASTKLSELGLGSGSLQVGNQTVTFTADTKLSEFVADLQAKLVAAGNTDAVVSFDEKTGAISITGITSSNFKITGDDGGKALLSKFFNTEGLDFKTAEVERKEIVKGQNAKFTINGVEMEKNTNSFELDGLNIQLLEKTDTAVTITTSRNTDQIYNGIVSFIEAYNSLLDKLNGLISEKAEYRDYPPLTDAQKKEMTENEIKLWEEKAKTGLLRSDSIISGLLSDMRTALYQKPATAQFALYEIGITTGEWQDKGKLVIEDPEKLRAAIENNPQDIYNLFNDKELGLAVQLNKLIDGAAKISSASPGSLVSLAGYSGMASDTQNTLSKQIASIDETLERLKNAYENEKNRYWNQFNTMEQLIQRMNQQSSWLAYQFS